MTIGQVAKAAGVSPSAIRFYESAGILPRPRRNSGMRDYDTAIVEHLKVLRFFRATGISIARLATMASTDARTRNKNRHAVVQRRIAELDDFIDEARSMKRRLQSLLDCTCGGNMKKCVIFTEESVRA